MSGEFRINYFAAGGPKDFKNSKAALSYIEEEIRVWSPYLESLQARNPFPNLQALNAAFSVESFSLALSMLRDAVHSAPEFNRITDHYYSGILPPPPSASPDGQLILNLFELNYSEKADSALLAYVDPVLRLSQSRQGGISDTIADGKRLLAGAYSVRALGLSRLGSSFVQEARNEFSTIVAGFNAELEAAIDRNKAQLKEETKQLADSRARSDRLDRVQRYLEVRRARSSNRYLLQTRERVENEFSAAEKRIDALHRLNKERFTKQEKEFQDLKALLLVQLRLKAPVALWETREKQHRRNAMWAFSGFLIAAVLTVAVALAVPWQFGDLIAQSFYFDPCLVGVTSCGQQLSVKGPLIVAGILLSMSVLLWVIRLQYRVYLSERHLALDASEKKAFVESYLALKHEANVDSANEAIVLSSVFRPTQDGIIRDDEGTLDISAAALLARQLSRNP